MRQNRKTEQEYDIPDYQSLLGLFQMIILFFQMFMDVYNIFDHIHVPHYVPSIPPGTPQSISLLASYPFCLCHHHHHHHLLLLHFPLSTINTWVLGHPVGYSPVTFNIL